ncbi:hypothetical protein AMEX_G23845 [Astyanax mexicanus]|uniref:Ig-like domain-containing protein n=1 Tax=Astyanax mexicanus TaxID=7994 RepID=A0A8T2KSQ6_ASTMX|nr:hypothetical protein AMEX_G23845 [Astyanax mexicanus]
MKILWMILLIFSSLLETTSEPFKVVGPNSPLVAETGEELVLPCSPQSSISAVDMTVKWIRPDRSDKLVHLYEGYEERNEKQIKSYRGRTSLFKEDLKNGNASLKLSALQPSDEGSYQCYIEYGQMYDDVTMYVEVKVKLKVVGPAVVALVAEAGEDLVLPCSLQPKISAEEMTVEWIRLHLKDQLVHRYEGYEDRNTEQIESYRGRTALFREDLKKGNTSLKLSSLKPSDEGDYQCYVESMPWSDNVNIHVKVKGKGFHAWKISIICISVFGVILTGLAAYILRDKYSDKDLSPKQCSAISYMRLQTENPRKEFVLKNFKTSEEGYRRLIPSITNCRKAEFAGCNLTVQSIKILGTVLKTENSSLKELDLSNSNLKDSGLELLSDGLKSPHCKVETLRFVGCNLTIQSIETLGAALKMNSSLKELDLSNNDLKDSGVELLSDVLKSSQLNILRLALCNLGKKTCDYLGTALLSESWPLKELDLSKNNLQDSGMEKLSAGLKSLNCELKTLRLASCNFTGKSCTFLKSALKSKISTLKELDLSRNDLQNSGVEELFTGLHDSQCKLETLRLALCNIGERFCEHLGSILNLGNTLIELDLSNNDLTDSGVEKLTAGLKSSHCKVQILRLSGCMITNTGCASLYSALRLNSSNLKELDLTYNHLEESGVKLLNARQEYPRCTPRVEYGGMIRIKPGLKKCKLAHTKLTLYPNPNTHCVCFQYTLITS